MLQALQTVGLDEKEGKVYLAILALGTSSVKDIAYKSELKRPTVYLYLEELVKKGFVQRIPLGKKKYYQPVSPREIERRLELNVSSFKKEIALLESIGQKQQGRPTVQVFEGEAGLHQVYKDMIDMKEIIFWSDLSSVERIFPEEYRKMSERVMEKKIFTREILADTPEARQSSKRWSIAAGDYYTSRLATGPIFNDSVIYDNVVCFFRLQAHNLFVVRIEDVTIATTLKTMFDMAWLSAKPFILK
jgi:sugar-specific transcriptional regulator TrmB